MTPGVRGWGRFPVGTVRGVKLKNWKPEKLTACSPAQDSRFSGFQVLTQPSQPRNSAD